MKEKKVKQVYDWDNQQKSMVTYKRTRKVNWLRVLKLFIILIVFVLLVTLIVWHLMNSITILY